MTKKWRWKRKAGCIWASSGATAAAAQIIQKQKNTQLLHTNAVSTTPLRETKRKTAGREALIRAYYEKLERGAGGSMYTARYSTRCRFQAQGGKETLELGHHPMAVVPCPCPTGPAAEAAVRALMMQGQPGRESSVMGREDRGGRDLLFLAQGLSLLRRLRHEEAMTNTYTKGRHFSSAEMGFRKMPMFAAS